MGAGTPRIRAPARYGLAVDASRWDWTRPLFDGVHLRVADLTASRDFYAAVLAPLGIPLIFDTPERAQFANFALTADGSPSAHVELAFIAPDRAAVDAFHAAAVDAGARETGAPVRREGGPPHVETYAAYAVDPDGTRVEAVCRIIR